MPSPKPEQRGRAEELARSVREPVGDLRQRAHRVLPFGAADEDANQVPVGRIAQFAPALELAREEAFDVLARGERDRPRLGLEGLHEDAPGRVPAAAPGKLRDELERALLGAEVRHAETRVGVDHRRERDVREVVPLGDHLRPDEHRALGGGEAPQRRRRLAGLLGRVGVEPKALELGNVRLQLSLEPLRPGADPRELDRAAGGAAVGRLRREAAVVTVQRLVAVQDERDVAIRAAPRLAARAAVQRRREAAAVEQEDRFAPALGELAELREQRRGQRVAGLAAQVDRAHRRTADADSLAQLEALEPFPALGARRRASVDRDGAFQRGALRSHRARVVARVGLLLVPGVVLLVDADQAEPRKRGEDGRARTDHDRRRP